MCGVIYMGEYHKEIDVTNKPTPILWITDNQFSRAEHFAFVEFRANPQLQEVYINDGEAWYEFYRDEFQNVLDNDAYGNY